MTTRAKAPDDFHDEIFDRLPVSALLYDVDGGLIKANRECLALFGVPDTNELAIGPMFEDPLLGAKDEDRLRQGERVQLSGEVDLFECVPSQTAMKIASIEKTITPLGQRGYLVLIQNVMMGSDALSMKNPRMLYRHLVESAEDLIWQCDTEGRYTYLNPAWERTFGYKREEMLGRRYFEFMTEDRAECDKKVFTSVLQKDKVFNYETVHIRKNGEPIDLSFTASYLIDESGEVIGVQGTARDISQQKAAERELLESQRRYRQMVQESPMGMHFYELRGDALVFTDYNQAANRLLQVDNAQFVGRSIEDAFPPLAETEIPTRYRQSARDGVPWSTEQVIYADNQIQGAYEVYAFQTSPGSMVAVFLEITDRKRTQAALQEEKERISVTLRSIGDGVIATDINGNITVMNRIAEALTGWSFKDAQGRPLTEVFHIIHELTHEPCENPVDKVLQTSTIVELENHTVLIARDGRRMIIADSGAPIFNEKSNIVGVVLVFRDVTERTKMSEAIQRSQRLESLGVLAGGIAHDFNNLLGGIFGYLDLARDVTSEENVRSYLEKAFFTMNRAKGLTHQLLTFAKGGGPILKTTAIDQLVEQSARFALSGTNVRISCEFEEHLWHCDVDESQFGQVIDNIVINSQQAMPLGGEISIRGKNITIASESHLSLPKGNYVLISLSDTGMGIPKEILPRIFDPFFTTKQKGSGLGLATSFSIVQKHGGIMDVESELGKGSVFTIYLPAADAEGDLASLHPAEPHRGAGRILVMDDEEFLREILYAMLKSLGYTPICVATGEAAVAALEAEDELDPIIAAILDLTIPGSIGGKETVKALHAIDERLPVMVTSGYSEDPVMSDPEAYGFVASITKPFRIRDLYETLCSTLANQARR